MKLGKGFLGLIIFLLGVFALKAQVQPGDVWKRLQVANGLVSNNVKDVLVESRSSIWIATDQGLVHYDGNNLLSYHVGNSALLSNDLRKLELAQNKLWIITAGGLSSFDGSIFENYTTANGLLDRNITGIAATSNDTLWIGSLNGVSKFDGNSFVHYPNKVAHSIEVDSADRVYILKYTIVVNAPFAMAEIYENGTWSSPVSNNYSFSINGPKLKKTADGELFIVSDRLNMDLYASVDYPFNLTEEKVKVEGSRLAGLGVFEQYLGRRWIGNAGQGSYVIAYSTRDSTADRHFMRIKDIVCSSISIQDSIVAIGSDSGLFYTSYDVRPQAYKEELAVNQIRTTVNTFGTLFHDPEQQEASFEFPKNNGTHGIYAANFVVAAKKQGSGTYTIAPLNPVEANYAPTPRILSNAGGVARDYLVKISKAEIDYHIQNYLSRGYVIPEAIAKWPASGSSELGVFFNQAPFVDHNNNGCYDPQHGDYPLIKGDVAIYWINHPEEADLKLEYHWMLYAFANPSNQALDQSVFLQFNILNRDNQVYDDIKVGFYADVDLGAPNEDYVGCDSLNNIFYVYNGTFQDAGFRGGPSFGKNVPALGVKFLSDSMTGFIYYNIGFAGNGDPRTEADWLNYLSAKWKSGQPLRYGGDGYQSSGVSNIPSNYMYSGDPYSNSGWTERNPGGGQNPNFPGDRRGLGLIPSFSLRPAERKTIELAIGYYRKNDTVSAVAENVAPMINLLNNAEAYWQGIQLPAYTYAVSDTCGPIITSIDKNTSPESVLIDLFPVPTKGQLTLRSSKLIKEVQLFDMKGASLQIIPLNGKEGVLRLEPMSEGIYLLRCLMEDNRWESRKIIIQR
jgi:hypothetical protein